MFQPDDLVRITGTKAGTFRVKEVRDDVAHLFGGVRRQWRAIPVEKLRPATKAEARTFLHAEPGLLQAARGIKPARPVK
jgi:hypothetical protein